MRAVKDGLPAPSEEGEESEGPRSTAAVEPIMGVIPRGRNKRAWKEHPINGGGRSTRAVEDHWMPPLEENTSRLGRSIGDLLDGLLSQANGHW